MPVGRRRAARRDRRGDDPDSARRSAGVASPRRRRRRVPRRAAPGGATRDVPLGTICGARSGDKGGNANVGVWARTPSGVRWLADYLTVERLRELMPEAARPRGRPLRAARTCCALNFVVKGLLGDGVAASLRSDPQAKSLGEYLRAKLVAIPESLLNTARE